jgi:hypothetical protein
MEENRLKKNPIRKFPQNSRVVAKFDGVLILVRSLTWLNQLVFRWAWLDYINMYEIPQGPGLTMNRIRGAGFYVLCHRLRLEKLLLNFSVPIQMAVSLLKPPHGSYRSKTVAK